MICDYSYRKAKKFVEAITSNKMYQSFDSAEQFLEKIISESKAIESEASELLKKAKDHYGACCYEIKEFSGKLSDAKRKLKNMSPVYPTPRIGLDGKPVTDKYGNVQQIFYINPEYAPTEADIADYTVKLKEANIDRDWTKEVIDKADALRWKYLTLKEQATNALQRLDCARRCFKDELNAIEDLAKKAINAASDALDVNIYDRTIVRYQCIPLLRKE